MNVDHLGTFVTVRQEHARHLAPVFTSRPAVPVGAPLPGSAVLIGRRAVNQRCLHQTLRGGISQVTAHSWVTAVDQQTTSAIDREGETKGHCQLRGIQTKGDSLFAILPFNAAFRPTCGIDKITRSALKGEAGRLFSSTVLRLC